MADDVKKIMEMSDEDLRYYMLSGDVGSYVLQLGQAEMNSRCALRTAEASQQMAEANHELLACTRIMVETNQSMAETNKDLLKCTRTMANANQKLVTQTRNLVWSTWGVVAITLITQLASIILLLTSKK